MFDELRILVRFNLWVRTPISGSVRVPLPSLFGCRVGSEVKNNRIRLFILHFLTPLIKLNIRCIPIIILNIINPSLYRMRNSFAQ